MGRAIIMHIDEAPWVRGGAKGSGEFPDGGGQLVGDLERGPWVHVNWLPGGLVAERRKGMKSTEASVRLGGQTFQEAFDAPGAALEALRTHVRQQPPGEPPWEWAPELFADGLIDIHFSLTERGQRFIQS